MNLELQLLRKFMILLKMEKKFN